MTANADAWVGDYGFSVDFPSQVDLAPFTQCRLIMRRPDGTTKTFDFNQPVFQSVGIGDTLGYQVEAGDLTVPGDYYLQVAVKDATRDLALGDPFKMYVGKRLMGDVWQ